MARDMTNFSDDDRDEDDIDREEDDRDEDEEEEEEDREDRGRSPRRRDRGDEVDEDDNDDDREEEEEEEDDDDDRLADLERIAGGDGRGMVPYPRLAAVVEQNHQLTQALLESRAAGTKPQKEEKPPVDIKALRKKHTEAILEGKDDEAAALAEQIDEANIAKAEERALARLREEQQQREQEAYTASMRRASDLVLSKYPSLNDFETDPDAADDMERIIVERDLLIRRGVPGPKAMRQAADKVMGGDEGGERRGSSPRDVRRRKERESLRERARTAGRIPPKTGGNGTGQRNRSIREPDTFSERQVKSMSEQEKRKARGDFDV